MFDAQLAVRGSVDQQQLLEVPAKRGVLALLGARNEPIVVLTAADMRSRLRNRLAEVEDDARTRSADLRVVTRNVCWKLAGSHFETDLHYLELARAIWPDTYESLIAWKPAWFVHVDVDEPFPHFSRTRDVLARSGRYFGPFMTGRSAEKFIGAVQDGFDLCRDLRCLRQAPHGQRCSYGQMGRCASPCDGSIPISEYRQTVARAADFVAGNRAATREELSERMQEASANLQFERASALKTRLERLEDFESRDFAEVRPVEQFRFLLVQSGGSSRRAAAFVAGPGTIESAGVLAYPLVEEELTALLGRMSALPGVGDQFGHAERLRMGLVSRYLFSGEERRGLVLRRREDLTAAQLGRAIESARDVLGLRPPRKRKETETKEGPNKATGTSGKQEACE